MAKVTTEELVARIAALEAAVFGPPPVDEPQEAEPQEAEPAEGADA